MEVEENSMPAPWTMRVQTEILTLRVATSDQNWASIAASIEALKALIVVQPIEAIGVTHTLLREARKTIDEIIPLVVDARDDIAGELRLLATGRKAIKAYG